jgi:hypothetical protein
MQTGARQTAGVSLEKAFSSCLQAACAADLARLAILGGSVIVTQQLNLPAAAYTQQQVAAMAAFLRSKQPGIKLAVDAGKQQGSSSSSNNQRGSGLVGVPAQQLLKSAAHVMRSRALQAAADAAVDEAAAAAAGTAKATLLSSGSSAYQMRRASFFRNSDGKCRVHVRHAGEVHMPCYSSALQAACAADLMRLALGKRSPTNLPRSIYTREQVAAMAELLLLERPYWRDDVEAAAAAAAAAEHMHSAAAVTVLQAGKLRAAAREAATAAAAVAMQAVPKQAAAFGARNRPHCCQLRDGTWKCRVGRLQTSAGHNKSFEAAWFKDALSAACAADLARLALYGDTLSKIKFNLPVHIYSSEQVASFAAVLAALHPGVQLVAAPVASHSNSSSIGSRRRSSSSSDSSSDEEGGDYQQVQTTAAAAAVSAAQQVSAGLRLGGLHPLAAQQPGSRRLWPAAEPAAAAAVVTAGGGVSQLEQHVHSQAAAASAPLRGSRALCHDQHQQQLLLLPAQQLGWGRLWPAPAATAAAGAVRAVCGSSQLLLRPSRRTAMQLLRQHAIAAQPAASISVEHAAAGWLQSSAAGVRPACAAGRLLQTVSASAAVAAGGGRGRAVAAVSCCVAAAVRSLQGEAVR